MVERQLSVSYTHLYQGATAKERNIVITLEMDSNYKENRNLLYRTFPIKRTGTMQYIEDGEAKAIEDVYKRQAIGGEPGRKRTSTRKQLRISWLKPGEKI